MKHNRIRPGRMRVGAAVLGTVIAITTLTGTTATAETSTGTDTNNTLHGTAGNDVLNSQDGIEGDVTCGEGGDDLAIADWADTVDASCERVVRPDITYRDLNQMFSHGVGDRATVVRGLDSLNNQMRVGKINNARRASAFLATVLNESGVRYNALQPGTSPYRGRGFIQLTGDFNYDDAGDFFDENFVAAPDKARRLAWSSKIARWYWYNNRHANGPADRMDMGRISTLIGYAPSATEDRERCEDFKDAMKHLTGHRPADRDVTCLRH